MTATDVNTMQLVAQTRMKDIVGILKDIPRSLVLVIRSMNLVRSINFDLGTPVNRFTLMARDALKSLATKNTSLFPLFLYNMLKVKITPS